MQSGPPPFSWLLAPDELNPAYAYEVTVPTTSVLTSVVKGTYSSSKTFAAAPPYTFGRALETPLKL